MALVGCLLGEMGDKGQMLASTLAQRFQRNRAIIAGIILAVVVNAVVAACAGAFIAPMLGHHARLLFLALAILFLSAGMIWPVRKPDMLDGWPTGPFLTTALGIFILGFGEGTQFLILGLVTRTADPALAALGGAIGTAAALIPAVLLPDRFAGLPLMAIRRGGGAIMLLISLVLGVQALGLA